MTKTAMELPLLARRHTLLPRPASRSSDDGVDLVDLLDRLLDSGVTLSGDLMLSVAGIDLVWVGLRAILSSVETARPRDSSIPHPIGPSETRWTTSTPVEATIADHAPPAVPDTGVLAAPSLQPVAPGKDRRIDIDDHDVGRGLAQLVLTVVDLLRQLLERQAITRMEGGGLAEHEVDRLGSALQQLAERMDDLKEMFGLSDDDLKLDLGPVGDLL